MNTPTKRERLRVIRTFGPGQAGALKLARRYGEDLVCVRYRYDESTQVRYTTVELIVDQAVVNRRPVPTVAVRLPPRDIDLRRRVMSAGGRWESRRGVWVLAAHAAESMGLICTAEENG